MLGIGLVFVPLMSMGKIKHEWTLQAKWSFNFRLVSLKAEMMIQNFWEMAYVSASAIIILYDNPLEI